MKLCQIIFVFCFFLILGTGFYCYQFREIFIESFDNGDTSDNSGADSSDSAGSDDSQPICFKKTPRNPTIFRDLKRFQTNILQLNRRMDTLQKKLDSLSTMRKKSSQGTLPSETES